MMSQSLARQQLARDLATVDAVLESARVRGDVVAEFSFTERKKELEAHLETLAKESENGVDVALLFGGAPVIGSQSIDAYFASRAISSFQEIVSKIFAQNSEAGLENQRGGVPLRDFSSLNITGVAYGSFGFLLSEKDSEQANLIPTALRVAVDKALEVISIFHSGNETDYSNSIEPMNSRVFSAAKSFYELLYRSEAVVRLVSSGSEEFVDEARVALAFERSTRTNVEEFERVIKGRLIGIGPTKQTFELMPEGATIAISGRTGARLSRDYLERIEREGLTLGHMFTGVILEKLVTKPSGAQSRSYTALDLTPDQ